MTLDGSDFWREGADSVFETTPSLYRPLERLDDVRAGADGHAATTIREAGSWLIASHYLGFVTL